MVIESGERDRRVEFQLPVYPDDDGSGGGAPRWDHLVYAYCKVETLREFERARFRALEDQSTHRFTMDYDPRVVHQSEARIVWDGRAFKIEGITDEDERHEELVILASEDKARPPQ